MKLIKKIFAELNVIGQCKKFRVSLWACPTFLFLLMGLVVIGAMMITYFLAKNYNLEPEAQALVVLITATITFIIGHFIVRSFDNLLEINKLKTRFLDIISHQMLTPLSSMKWALSLLKQDDTHFSEEEKNEFFGIIKQSSDDMINIINSLLDVSRIDTGRIKLNITEFNLQDVVEEVMQKRANDVKIKEASVILDFEKNIPNVIADPMRIKVVVDSLIDNAVKFGKQGSGIIIQLYQDKNRVVFSVQDFGVGISKKERKHLFKKFFRSDEKAVRLQTKGFGLGLYVAQFIVEACGGKIDFESEEGIGSKFWFYLPTVNKN